MNTIVKKKDLIYFYVIQGYYANEIKSFKDIKCSKSYVSKILKNLIKDGFIEPVKVSYKKQKKFVRYRKTLKIYPVKFTDLSSSLDLQYITRPRLNFICLKYDFVRFPGRNVNGEVYFFNNTRCIVYRHVFPEGSVTFRVISDKVLVVYIPEHIVSADHFRHTKDYLYRLAEKYVDWFMNEFDCVVCNPSKYQDFHIAVEENDPVLCDLTEKYGLIKMVDFKGNVIGWYDRSKGYAEFETRNEDLAEIKAFMPLIVRDLQSRVFSMQDEMESQRLYLDVLNSKLEQVECILSDIKSMLSPRKPGVDEKKEVT